MSITKLSVIFISLFIFPASVLSAKYEIVEDDLALCPAYLGSRINIVQSFKEENTLYGLFKIDFHSVQPFELPAKLIGSKMYVDPEFIDLIYENLSGDWVWYRKSVHHKKANQIISITKLTDYEIVMPLPDLEQVKFSRTWILVVRSADGGGCITSEYLSAKLKREPVVKRLKSE